MELIAPYTGETLWTVEWLPGATDLWVPARTARELVTEQVYVAPVLIDILRPTDGRLVGCQAWDEPTLLASW